MITSKTCSGPCGQTLDIDQFHWKSKRRGTRQNRCKECMKAYGKTHYIANSQKYKDRANTRLRALRAGNRQLVKDWISSHKCSKCEESNPKVLSTDLHSNEINNLSTEDLLLKLEQCTVLCRNCEASKLRVHTPTETLI